MNILLERFASLAIVQWQFYEILVAESTDNGKYNNLCGIKKTL